MLLIYLTEIKETGLLRIPLLSLARKSSGKWPAFSNLAWTSPGKPVSDLIKYDSHIASFLLGQNKWGVGTWGNKPRVDCAVNIPFYISRSTCSLSYSAFWCQYCVTVAFFKQTALFLIYWLFKLRIIITEIYSMKMAISNCVHPSVSPTAQCLYRFDREVKGESNYVCLEELRWGHQETAGRVPVRAGYALWGRVWLAHSENHRSPEVTFGD